MLVADARENNGARTLEFTTTWLLAVPTTDR
jgi:hypothetical protein